MIKNKTKKLNPIKYKEVKRKSQSGVQHIKYIPILPKNPLGFNYQARKVLDAIAKRTQEGREYYVVQKGKRKYIKDDK